MNIHWPATPNSNLLPWYVILWRAPWWPVVFAGRVLFAAGIGAAFLSWASAEQAWDATA